MRDYSVVSQIINDFGDLLGVAGYQIATPSGRVVAEESHRKPTLPLIWAACKRPADVGPLAPLLMRARSEIDQRKDVALQRLARLALSPGPVQLLTDFFASPSIPKAWEHAT